MIITDQRYDGLLPERTPYYISSLAERFFLLNYEKQNPLIYGTKFTDFRYTDTADGVFVSGDCRYIIETKLRQYYYSYLSKFDSGALIEIRKYNDLIRESIDKDLPVLYIQIFLDGVILIYNLNEVKPILTTLERNDGRSYYSVNKTDRPAYILPYSQACIEYSSVSNSDNIFFARNRLFTKTGNRTYLTTSINKHHA